jgi:hypothetical protein
MQYIKKERISYGEIAKLQNLEKYIDPSDIELRPFNYRQLPYLLKY